MTDDRFHDDLHRFWDAVLHGEAAAADDLDPALVRTILRLHANDLVPPADAASVHRLREELMKTPTITTKRWERATIDGLELEYDLRGAGEPVVLMHAGVCADFFTPLVEQPALSSRYRVLSYHRVGYAGSSHVHGPVSIAQQAAHCRALMAHLEIDKAHIVGHSSSAMMALQLALDAPDTVRSLALLDAARPAPPTETQRDFVDTVVRPAMQQYQAGDKAGAVDAWMQGVCGPGYRSALERVLPTGFEQAVADADTFFAQELPAVQQWSFTPEEARRVTQPVLLVLGEQSRPTFRERQELLREWLPATELYILPEATHLLQVENPRDMAAALASFFARHPLSVAT
jgi:pimeloyl-ACP methyl ester carboxylesterase